MAGRNHVGRKAIFLHRRRRATLVGVAVLLVPPVLRTVTNGLPYVAQKKRAELCGF